MMHPLRWLQCGLGLTSTCCELPCKVVGVLDAGVHSKSASRRETMGCIARQKCIADLHQLHTLSPVNPYPPSGLLSSQTLEISSVNDVFPPCCWVNWQFCTQWCGQHAGICTGLMAKLVPESCLQLPHALSMS